MRITTSLLSSTFVAFWLSAPSVAHGQAYEIHHNFIDSQFDKILRKNQFILEGKYVSPALKPYFAKFFHRKDLDELINANFECVNRICNTQRYQYLMGAITPNITRTSWDIKVDLSKSACPEISIQFGYDFNPGYRRGQ